MLSRIDDIIFPNRCEVIQLPSHRFIYPIFKNGSTSIIEHATQQKYKILFNNQIKRASVIDIVLRDPVKRYVSGFNTFVYNTKKENPELDISTIIYFSKNYLFLNRHYAPQLFWLYHLNKYTDPQTKLNLRDISTISEYTPLDTGPDQEFILSDSVVNEIVNDVHIKIYLELEEALLTLVGQELTFSEILKQIESMHPHGFIKCFAPD